MNGRAAALAVLLVLLGAPTVAAAEVEVVTCTEHAEVHWETDWDEVTVVGAIVEVPGCDDGEEVGLQLLTVDGDLPTTPLYGQVVDGHVRFDLQAMHVRIEPVVGVRVLLSGDSVVETVEIVVEQRFFTPSGNEQRGLARTTPLSVQVGAEYVVPGAPTRYDVVACSDMTFAIPDGVVGQGAGTFVADEPGLHLVCYQQRPGTAGGPPDVEDPQVPDTGVLGDEVTAPGGASPGGSLATTGANLLSAGVVGLALIVVGQRLRRRRS